MKIVILEAARRPLGQFFPEGFGVSVLGSLNALCANWFAGSLPDDVG